MAHTKCVLQPKAFKVIFIIAILYFILNFCIIKHSGWVMYFFISHEDYWTYINQVLLLAIGYFIYAGLCRLDVCLTRWRFGGLPGGVVSYTHTRAQAQAQSQAKTPGFAGGDSTNRDTNQAQHDPDSTSSTSPHPQARPQAKKQD